MRTPLVKSVIASFELATDAERREIVDYIKKVQAPLSDKASNTTLFVDNLFSTGKQMSASNVMAVCQLQMPQATRKEIYHALGYLARRGTLRRIRQGVYETAVTRKVGSYE